MELDPEVVQLWFRYEEIAMHFNTLIMQYRLQLMGGLGAIGTVAAYLVGGKIDDIPQRNWVRFLVSSGILVLIAAAAALDIFYYDRLLRGAVAALLEFEKAHPAIQMSTKIEETVGSGKDTAQWVYASVLCLLAIFTIWSLAQHRRTRRRPAQ